MLRSAASKIAWLARATTVVVGLAIMLALVVGVASAAFGANNGNFILGVLNKATAKTQLNGNVAGGPALQVSNNRTEAGSKALQLNVAQNKPPLAVNSAAGKAKNLNADELDGKDSSAFAPAQAEGWHEVGASGEPPFNNQLSSSACDWKNFNATDHQTAAFFRDPFGVVHLKGVVDADDANLCDFDFSSDRVIFTLPEGYRPAKRSVHVVLTNSNSNSQLGEVNVDPDGRVSVAHWINEADAKERVSLDGIIFRAAN